MARKPPQQRSNYEKRLKSSAAKVPAAPAPAVVHKRQGNRDSGDDDPAADVLLRAAAVRRRYGGASDMWIHRRLNDNTGFPRPIYLGTIRHWRLSELIEWECAQAALPTPEARIVRHRREAATQMEQTSHDA